MTNDVWMISQEAILIINSVTVVTTNKPSFHSPISYLRRVGVCVGKKYVHDINMKLNFKSETTVIV